MWVSHAYFLFTWPVRILLRWTCNWKLSSAYISVTFCNLTSLCQFSLCTSGCHCTLQSVYSMSPTLYGWLSLLSQGPNHQGLCAKSWPWLIKCGRTTPKSPSHLWWAPGLGDAGRLPLAMPQWWGTPWLRTASYLSGWRMKAPLLLVSVTCLHANLYVPVRCWGWSLCSSSVCAYVLLFVRFYGCFCWLWWSQAINGLIPWGFGFCFAVCVGVGFFFQDGKSV